MFRCRANIAVQDVAPSVTFRPDTQASAPSFVPIPLSEWKEAPFFLSDKDIKESMDGVIPMQASSAISNLSPIKLMSKYILNQYKGVYNWVDGNWIQAVPSRSTIAVPFSKPDLPRLANKASQILNENRCPKFERRAVLNPAAQAAALDIRAFQDLSWSGENYGIEGW